MRWSWKTHGKVIAQGLGALVLAVFATVRTALDDHAITPSEWVLVVIAAFTVFTVWGAANIPGFEKAKTLMGAIGVLLSLLVAAIVGGITNDEWLMLGVEFLTALGVAGAPALKHVAISATKPADTSRSAGGW